MSEMTILGYVSRFIAHINSVLDFMVVNIEMNQTVTLKHRVLGHVVSMKLCGDACNHTHEWQLLRLNMGLNGNFYFLFLLYYILCFLDHHQNYP